MPIKPDVLSTIGDTPLVRLNRVTDGLKAAVCAKLEQFNPMTSIKDRPALAMVQRAEAEGRLKPGSIIAEPTSGNTGLGLAMVGAVKGYRVILFMEEMDRLRSFVLTAEALGAEVVTAHSFQEAVAMALQLQKDDPRVFVPHQFVNRANPDCHEATTAQEILRDAGPSLRAFVGGMGSGGTITGVGRALKRHDPSIRIILAEPDTASIISGGPVGCSEIPGMGPTFRPELMDTSVVDQVLRINSKDARAFMRRLGREEGILCGPSSGALGYAATLVAREYGPGDVVVTVFPDFGMRYLFAGAHSPSPSQPRE
jgi:cysteine synthase A